MDAWETAQHLELEHWLQSQSTQDILKKARPKEEIRAGYEEVSKRMWARHGIDVGTFRNKVCLEIGAGPTGRCLALRAAHWAAIDPLLVQYKDYIPWAQLDHFDDPRSCPAERMLPDMFRRYDFIACINALDHCRDPKRVMQNAWLYLVNGGSMFLSLDVAEAEGDDMHHAMTIEQLEHMIFSVGFHITNHYQCKAFPARDGSWLDAYGGGIAHHYWLAKCGG